MMKKIIILLAAMAMATLAAQANDLKPTTDAVMAMETETPAPETNTTTPEEK